MVAAQKDPPRDDEIEARTWDPPRVARHLERAAAQAYRAYRRTRWLKLLDDAEVVYREPGATRTRGLRIRAGQVSAADQDDPLPVLAAPADASFDRACYDRLRILTTELKRIARDGGHVLVSVQAGRPLPPRLLPGVFAVI